MQQEKIGQKIIEIASWQFAVSVPSVRRESLLVADLGADSLDMIEMAMAVEDEFEIEMPDEVVERFATVGDVIDFVSGLSG